MGAPQNAGPNFYEAIPFTDLDLVQTRLYFSLHVALGFNLLAHFGSSFAHLLSCLLPLRPQEETRLHEPHAPPPPKSPQVPARIHPIRSLSHLPRAFGAKIREQSGDFFFKLGVRPSFPSFFDSVDPPTSLSALLVVFLVERRGFGRSSIADSAPEASI
jgi:hypothetical protein